MVCFPLFVDLNDKTVLVVGGGPVAARKARVLLDYGPRVLVCAPSFAPELEQLSGTELLRRPFSPELLEGVSLAVAATGDREVNHWVSGLCRARSIPVNVADSREDSTFLFPAVVRRGRLSVGISTGGASPAAAAHVRSADRAIEREAARRTAQTGGKEIDERQVTTLRPGSGRARSLPFSFRGSLWKKSII